MLASITNSMHRILEPVCKTGIILSRVALAIMMGLITIDVILRYFFNSPIPGSYEIVEFLMVVVVFLGLSQIQITRQHLSINIFTSRFSKPNLVLAETFTHLLSCLIFSFIAWRCFLQAMSLFEAGETSGVLNIVQWPFMGLVGLGCVMISLVYLKQFLESLSDMFDQWSAGVVWALLIIAAGLLIISTPYWGQAMELELDNPVVGLWGIILMLVLLFMGMPLGPTMALMGFVGFALLTTPDAGLSILGTSPFRSGSSQNLSTIPLFVLMGLFCFHSDLSGDIYATVRAWMGRMPGGLAMSTVGASAGFAAVSGSSLANTVTMGTIALPEMRKYKYADSLACGSIASGGSIGILIPPSVPFIIYASLAEESIGKLFMAGFVPGVVEALLYMITIYIMCKLRPSMGPPGPGTTFKEKIVSLKGTWGIILLFALVIGGIYLGIYTPTEAAGVGAMGALLLGLAKRKLTKQKILICLADACSNTSKLLLMIVGADIFGYFLTISQIPDLLAEFVVGLPVHGIMTIVAILLVYIVLGGIMPIIPAIVLTVPVFLPVVDSLGYSPIWFGVLMVSMAEIGQITPPVGINVFTMAGVAKDVELGTIYRGIFPFLLADFVRVALILAIPAMALWLPSLMY